MSVPTDTAATLDHTGGPAAPTSPGTDTGTPATGAAMPGVAAPPRGERHVVGRVEDVPPGEGRAFVAGGVQLAVFRLRDGSLRATQAACPHAGGPLADGQTDASVLVCPLHLYAFRWSDGCAPGSALALRTYPVADVDGHLVVEV